MSERPSRTARRCLRNISYDVPKSPLYPRRYVVHAEMEEIRISAATGDEGLAGREALLHVPLEPEEQSAKVQARPAMRERPRPIRALALGANRTVQGRRTRPDRSRYRIFLPSGNKSYRVL